MDLKELYEKRAETVKAIAELQTLNSDDDHDWCAEDEERWTSVNAEYDKLTAQIEKAERAEQLAAEQIKRANPEIQRGNSFPEASEADRPIRTTPTQEDRLLAFQAWLRAGTDLPQEERHERATQLCGVDPNSRAFDMQFSFSDDFRRRQAEFRALSAVTLTAGAVTIPEGFIPRLEHALLTYGGMMQVATIINTTSGQDLPWPTTNDTTNKGRLIAENTAVTETDITYGAITLQAYQYSSDMVRVPFVLLQDSAFNLANEIGDALGIRLARILNEHFTTGDGAAKPYGIVNASTLGVTSASATAIAWSEITDLIHSVDPSYRPGARFMYHDNVMLYLRKLVDGQGLPLWQADPNGVAPATLQGYPYTINQDMSSTITSGDITILFGQLGKYKIRTVSTLRLRRLDERYAEYDQVAFLAYWRADGNLLDAGTNPVKHIAQA